jgi:hypothetical protein
VHHGAHAPGPVSICVINKLFPFLEQETQRNEKKNTYGLKKSKKSLLVNNGMLVNNVTYPRKQGAFICHFQMFNVSSQYSIYIPVLNNVVYSNHKRNFRVVVGLSVILLI